MSETPATPAPAVEQVTVTTLPEPAEVEAPVVAPADPAAAPAPDAAKAKDEKLAARFEAAKAAELRGRRVANEARTAADKVKADQEAIAKDRAQLEQERALLANDPIAALTAAGVTDIKAWLQRVVTPASEESRRLAELEKREKARETEATKAAEAAKAKDAEARERQEMVGFVRSIAPETHPHTVARYEPHEIPAVVKRVKAQHGDAFEKKYGRAPTLDEVRDYIEAESQEWASAEHRRALAPKIFKTGEAPRVASDPKSGTDTAGAAPGGSQENGSGHQGANGPRTLTNDHAAQVTSGRPSKEKSRKERLRDLAAQLEAEDAARAKA